MEELLAQFLKLVLVLVISGLIGLEREITGHKAGIRTLILVGIGSASLVMIADNIDLPENELGRIIAGVATGIGFLGAGAIIKEGINVKGLTTAATIWVTASIGVAIGSGAIYIGVIVFCFTFIVLSIFGIIERKLNLKPSSGTIAMTMKKGYQLPKKDLRKLQRDGVGIRRMDLENTEKGLKFYMDIEIPRKIRVADFIERTRGIEGLRSVEWEDTDPGGPETYLDRF